MAESNINPLRKSFKHVKAANRNLRQLVRRKNEELQKEARGEVVRKRRNISEKLSPSNVIVEQGKIGMKSDKRREELLAWKAKRNRQKELEVKKRTKFGEFVVKHVNYSPPKYLAGKDLKGDLNKKENREDEPEKRTRYSVRLAQKRNEAKNKTEKDVDTKVIEAKVPTKSEHEVKKRIAKPLRKETAETRHNDKKGNVKPGRSAKTEADKTGFAFPLNVDKNVPKAFTFGKKSPGFSFSSSALSFQDPIAMFNESIKQEKEVRIDTQMAKNSFAFDVCDDPIAKFNASLKSDGNASLDGIMLKNNDSVKKQKTPMKEKLGVVDRTVGENGHTIEQLRESKKMTRELMITKDTIENNANEVVPIRVLRDTPQRSAYHSKVFALDKNRKSKLSLGNLAASDMMECPIRTPTKSSMIPQLEELNSGSRFTPRRIKSTKYFKDLLEKEKTNFTTLNAHWTIYLEKEEQSEEVSGEIRSVIGQAKLLMDQRFQQFESLIQVHQNHQQQQGATASDLQGFWDMISYQIMDVHQKFSTLKKKKQSNWIIEESIADNIKIKKVIEKKKKESKKLTARQEETRKFKKEMRARMQRLKSDKNESGIEILKVDSAQKFDTMPNIDDTPLIDDGMKNNEDESSDERARSSSNEMSADSLEEEGNTAKLCTQLKNVKLGYSKNVGSNLVSPLKDIGNLCTHQKQEENIGDESLFGLGFEFSPKKKMQSLKHNESEIALISFD